MAVVIINEHEPHGETANRLLALAEEKGYDARVVEAQRGEHDAALSFRVPEDVAEAFNEDRADRWPTPATDAGDSDSATQGRTSRPGKAPAKTKE